MNLSELIPILADRCAVDEKLTSKIVDELFEMIEEAVDEGKQVRIWKFGKFLKREYKERKCYNPITDKIEVVGNSSVPVFKPGTRFKARLNK